MATTTTRKNAKSETVSALANVGLSDVVTAWDEADKQDRTIGTARGAIALASLRIGAYLLGLDAKHDGDATAANAEFREQMSTDYDARGKEFRWVKSRASKSRNLARGTLALATAGMDVSTDADAVIAMGTLASNVGADGIADAVKSVATLVKDGKPVGEAIREVMRGVRAPKPNTLAVTLEAAIEALDTYAAEDGPWSSLTDAEVATLKPLAKRLATLAASVNADIAKR